MSETFAHSPMDTDIEVFAFHAIRSEKVLKVLYRVKIGGWHTTAVQSCPFPRPRYQVRFLHGWELQNSYYISEADCKRSFDFVVERLGI